MTDPKVALVTGASKGIGLETARLLVARGWKVAITARGAAALEAAAAGLGAGNALALPCDVADPDAARAAAEAAARAFGPVRALVNNAGVIDPVGRLHEMAPDAWMELQRINLGGVFNMCRAVLPGMIEAGGGVIVNLSSGAAQRPMDGWSAYCTSKAGLAMLTRCLDTEYREMGIRVHDFIPGVVGTDMLNGAQQKFDNAAARLDDSVKLTPDIPARCIAWLVDEGEGRADAVHQSIRDPEFRAKVGLEERAQW
jgi:NAD(P)-dependent dehydrogenase (short-subunit alcohol dehydrogenase family)